ncbi:MAG: class II fructose-bisphosphate aldolase [Armatimonadetes bacterium]|nr:class II fructose-bisphosphate aldolase [Armatimonadota bacterium]
MSLHPVLELVHAARQGGYAVGYFESWNLESLQGVIDAAEQTRSPVILGFNGEFLTHPGRRTEERIAWYAALARAAAESAGVPCGLMFNECAREEPIRQAIAAGFSMVMLDDPEAAPADLTRRVAELARYAHTQGVAVEAEAGELPCGAGGEVAGGGVTDPAAAARFVAETGIDVLAVSVGNVHILLRGERQLDLERLAAIRRAVSVPLDLHGGSGIPAESLREAIALGVAKVCHGTYVKQRYLDALRGTLNADTANPHQRLGMGGEADLLVAGRLAVRDAVLERIELLGCCGRA